MTIGHEKSNVNNSTEAKNQVLVNIVDKSFEPQEVNENDSAFVFEPDKVTISDEGGEEEYEYEYEEGEDELEE